MDTPNAADNDLDEPATYTTVYYIPLVYSNVNHHQPNSDTNNNNNNNSNNNNNNKSIKQPRKRPCLDLLKELVKSKDLQVDDVESVLRSRRSDPRKEHTPIKVKAEPADDDADVILIEDDEDVANPASIKAEYPPDAATTTDDSGLPSSISSYSSVCRDWLDSSQSESSGDDADDRDVVYAQPVNAGADDDSDYYYEEFWKPPEIVEGHIYLVSSEAGCWNMAKLIKKLPEKQYKLVLLHSFKTVKVGRRRLALARPPTDVFVKVGGRVVAALRTFVDTGELKGRRGRFTPGVVGETPSGYNDFRYLVIFDNGYWLYVKPQLVRPIFVDKKRVWKILPKKRRRDVKDFLKGRFRPVRNFERGQLVSICDRKSDDIQYGDVIAVDSSLVLIRYQTIPKTEWIHRGCQRLQLVN